MPKKTMKNSNYDDMARLWAENRLPKFAFGDRQGYLDYANQLAKRQTGASPSIDDLSEQAQERYLNARAERLTGSKVVSETPAKVLWDNAMSGNMLKFGFGDAEAYSSYEEKLKNYEDYLNALKEAGVGQKNMGYDVGYSPMSNVLMQATGAQPNPEAERWAVDPVYEGMRAAGVPRQLPLPEQARYSPMAIALMRSSGVAPGQVDDRRALATLSELGIASGAGRVADRMAAQAAFQRARAIPDVTERMLSLNEVQGAFPELSPAIHGYKNDVQRQVLRDYLSGKATAQAAPRRLANVAQEHAGRSADFYSWLEEMGRKSRLAGIESGF